MSNYQTKRERSGCCDCGGGKRGILVALLYLQLGISYVTMVLPLFTYTTSKGETTLHWIQSDSRTMEILHYSLLDQWRLCLVWLVVFITLVVCVQASLCSPWF